MIMLYSLMNWLASLYLNKNNSFARLRKTNITSKGLRFGLDQDEALVFILPFFKQIFF